MKLSQIFVGILVLGMSFGSLRAEAWGLSSRCGGGIAREAFSAGAASTLRGQDVLDAERLQDLDQVCFGLGAEHAEDVLALGAGSCGSSLQRGYRLGLRGAHYLGQGFHRECNRLGWEWGRTEFSWNTRLNRRPLTPRCRRRYLDGKSDSDLRPRTYRDYTTNAALALCYRLGFQDGERGSDWDR